MANEVEAQKDVCLSRIGAEAVCVKLVRTKISEDPSDVERKLGPARKTRSADDISTKYSSTVSTVSNRTHHSSNQ